MDQKNLANNKANLDAVEYEKDKFNTSMLPVFTKKKSGEETTSVSVQKIWDDNGNNDGKRPTSITVELTANGVGTGKTLRLSEANSWRGEWNDLAKCANGKEIEYSVAEITLPDGYSAKTPVVEEKDGAFSVTLTNTYAPDKTYITVKKDWDDGNNYDGLRPGSITVQLYADGDPVENAKVTLPLANGAWSYTFDSLPKYVEGKVGQEIKYTVKEENVPAGYEETYIADGQIITIKNTHELYERYSLAVEKVEATNTAKKLQGARFEVYEDKACTKRVGVIVTDENGQGQVDDLLEGTCWVLEKTTPAGYQLDSTLHDGRKTVKLENTPIIGALTLKKTVTGGASTGLSFKFEVALSNDTGDTLAGSYDAPLNGVATKVKFTETAEGASASVTLGDGDVLTILGLRKGTAYVITEQEGDLYDAYVDGKLTNRAEGEISDTQVSLAAFENRLQLTSIAVKKLWTGEKLPVIRLTLYQNGKAYSTDTPVPNADGVYEYRELPAIVNGKEAVYTAVETPVKGYTTTYVNTGANEAKTDCAYDGGTIVNSKILQTGDNTPLLWMLTLVLAAFGLTGLVTYTRKRGN